MKESFSQFITTPRGLILASLLLGWLLIGFSSKKKGKLSTSYWGGNSEKEAAKRKALSQIKNSSRNNVALYIGSNDFLKQLLKNLKSK